MRLKVQTNEGPYEVQAKQFGLLAVHRRPMYDPSTDKDQWSLSHIPTGMNLRSDLLKEQAVQLAEALQELDWDWNLTCVPQGIAKRAQLIIKQVLSGYDADRSALPSAAEKVQT